VYRALYTSFLVMCALLTIP